MDLHIKEVEEKLCSAELDPNFIYYLNGLCKQRIIQFETFVEIVFLKLVREKDSNKLLNTARNLALLSDGGDVRQVFYNIILSNINKGLNDEFLFQPLGYPEAKSHIVNFIVKLPIGDVKKFIDRLVLKVPPFLDYALYLEVLSHSDFYAIDKFTKVFDDCVNDLKQRIFLAALVTNNLSVASKINAYFQSSPITFHNFNNDINNDYNLIVRAIVEYTPISTLMYSLSEFKNMIFARHLQLPLTIRDLVLRAIKENHSYFIMEAASVFSKREIIGMMHENGATKMVEEFLLKFGEDPELEHLVPFA